MAADSVALGGGRAGSAAWWAAPPAALAGACAEQALGQAAHMSATLIVTEDAAAMRGAMGAALKPTTGAYRARAMVLSESCEQATRDGKVGSAARA